MLKLTAKHVDAPVYIPFNKITGIWANPDGGCFVEAGDGGCHIRESAEDAMRAYSTENDRRESAKGRNIEPPEATELRAFMRMAEKRELPSLDSINGARRHLGYAELKELPQ
jgi:hypothetical protein